MLSRICPNIPTSQQFICPFQILKWTNQQVHDDRNGRKTGFSRQPYILDRGPIVVWVLTYSTTVRGMYGDIFHVS